jgi:hypothetical protein
LNVNKGGTAIGGPRNRLLTNQKGWQDCHPFILAEYVCCLLNDVDFSALETDDTFGGSEEGVVSSHADVEAGEEFGAALAYDYRAGRRFLAAEQLYAAILGVAVSAVSGRALTFFMCHSKLPLIQKEPEFINSTIERF